MPDQLEILTLAEVLELHEAIIAAIGGSPGVRDMGGIESALAQPQMTFGGDDFYPTLSDKAAALGFSLIKNHAFVDGNKRAGHAAMLLFLDLNGHAFACGTDESERVIKSVAAGTTERDEFTEWVRAHTIRLKR